MSKKHRERQEEEPENLTHEEGTPVTNQAPSYEEIVGEQTPTGVLAPLSPEYVAVVNKQKELQAAGVMPTQVSEDAIAQAMNTPTDQGLGEGDGLEIVARALGFPLPEDPSTTVKLAPGDEPPLIVVEQQAKSVADAWNMAAQTKPAVVTPIGSLRNDPLIRQSEKAVVAVKKGSDEERAEIARENVRQNAAVYGKSLMEENAKPSFVTQEQMTGGFAFDGDPISRALGLIGCELNKTWEWFRTPGRLGQQLMVNHYYFQVPPLKMPLAVDLFTEDTSEIRNEIQMKSTILPTKGIIYWALLPGQQITRGMRDMVMAEPTEPKVEAPISASA
jgi:hypothetical protein